VRNKYFTVELTAPVYDPSGCLGVGEAATAGDSAELDFWSWSIFSNLIRELRLFPPSVSAEKALPFATAPLCTVNASDESFYPIISFLARNELPEYYLLLRCGFQCGEVVRLGFKVCVLQSRLAPPRWLQSFAPWSPPRQGAGAFLVGVIRTQESGCAFVSSEGVVRSMSSTEDAKVKLQKRVERSFL
jgi:hypothetical protein